MSKDQYSFFVVHRNINVIKDSTGELQASTSPGHLSAGVKINDTTTLFGKYPEDSESLINLVAGSGKVSMKAESRRHEDVTDFIKKSPDKGAITIKEVIITKEQYEAALEYGKSKAVSKEGNTYILGFADCTDFVQEMYHAAGTVTS